MIRMWNYRGLVSIQRLAEEDIRASAGVALSGEASIFIFSIHYTIDIKVLLRKACAMRAPTTVLLRKRCVSSQR